MAWYWIILIIIGYLFFASMTGHYLPKICYSIDEDDAIFFAVIWPAVWLIGIPIGLVYLIITWIVDGLLRLDDFWDYIDKCIDKWIYKK